MAMNDSHRLFLQSIMAHGIFNSNQVLEFYSLACNRIGETPDKDKLGDFVHTINSHIKPLSLDIKKGIGEHNGKSYYALVNTTAEDITKLASHYTPNELEYFKKLIEVIIESDTGTISSMKAVNLGSLLTTKIDVQEGQNLIDCFMKQHWVDEPETKKGHVCLSTRSILELTHYMETQYPGQVVKCELCHKLCLQGQNCARCDARVHLFCGSRYFKEQKEPRCPMPNCGAVWNHGMPEIVPGSEAPRGSRRSPNKAGALSGARGAMSKAEPGDSQQGTSHTRRRSMRKQ